MGRVPAKQRGRQLLCGRSHEDQSRCSPEHPSAECSVGSPRQETECRRSELSEPHVLRKKHGRYHPIPFDQMKRPMIVLTPRGKVTLDVRGARSASLLGRYYNAVDEYLKTGSIAALRSFRGETIRVGNVRISLVTDPEVLERLARAGEVRFEEIYESSA